MVISSKKLSPSNSIRRLAWIDVLRGIAILAVVFYHAEVQVTVGMNTNLGAITTINDAVSPFRMPILMFLSGILLPLSLAKPWATYLKGKLRKVAWPYIVWSFVFLGALFVTAPYRGEVVELEEFVKIFYAPPTYHWYLAYLVIFYVVSLLLSWSPQVRTMTIPLTLIGATLVDGELERVLFLWAFFMAGDAIASYWGLLQPIIIHPATAVICALATIPVLVVASSADELRYNPLWAVGIFAAVFALRPVLVLVAPTFIGSIFAAVGRQSIVFYVSHYLIIALSFHVLLLLGMKSPLSLFFLTSTISLFVGYVLVSVRDHPLGVWLFEWRPRHI